MYIWKMDYNFQLNYNYTTKIRYFGSKLGICMRNGNMTHPDPHEGLTNASLQSITIIGRQTMK